MKSKTIPIIFALAVVLAGAVAWWVWRGPPAARDPKNASAAPVPVTVANAVVRKVPIILSVIGRAEAKASVSQILTLYITPVIYLYLDRVSQWLDRDKADGRGPVRTPNQEIRLIRLGAAASADHAPAPIRP
jgi:hypothetical protein